MATDNTDVIIRLAAANSLQDILGISNVGHEAFKAAFASQVSAEDAESAAKTRLSPSAIKHSLRNSNLRTWVAVRPGSSGELWHNNMAGWVAAGLDNPEAPTVDLGEKWKFNDMVGFVTVRMDNPETTSIDPTYPDPVELQRIYVRPRYQGGGIGRMLVETVHEWARGQGFRSVWLGILQENEVGLRFYEGLGYRRIGERPFTWSSGRVDVEQVMARML